MKLNIKHNYLVLFILLTLPSCSADSWFGEENKIPLAGERIPVTQYNKAIEVDSSLDDKIYEPAPIIRNQDWNSSLIMDSAVSSNLYLARNLVPKHRYRTSAAQNFILETTPIIVEGKIITLDRQGTVICFDINTAKIIWKNKFFKLHSSSGILSTGTEYFSGGLLYIDGIIYATSGVNDVIAIDIKNGNLIWQKRINSITRSVPVYHQNKLFIQTIDNNLYALNAKNGDMLWTHWGIKDEVNLISATAPVVYKNLVIAKYTNGEIYAFDINTGEEQWSQNLHSLIEKISINRHLYNVVSVPLVDNDVLFAYGNDGALSAFDIGQKGKLLWKQEIGVARPIWISGDFIYALNNDNYLIAVYKYDGRIKWMQDLNTHISESHKSKQNNRYWTAPIVADNAVIVANSVGNLDFFDLITGKYIKDIKIDLGVYLPPVIANGDMYVLSNNGIITQYTAK